MATLDIASIFGNTDSGYLASCLAQRQPGQGGAGSRFLMPMTAEELIAANWQPYDHPDVASPAIAFKAPIKGNVGLVDLTTLDPKTEVTLDDRKGTGWLMPTIMADMGPEVEHTTLLVGPSRENAEKLIVWTFFPGDPIQPSKVAADETYKHGDVVTAKTAIELGLKIAKVE